MKNKGSTQRHGFTLIELLVVIAIIGMLASIVLVSFKGTREKGALAVAQQFSAQVTHALGAYAVGQWRFEEGTGDIANDSSGYGNNGDLAGPGVSCGSGGSCPTWKAEAVCELGFGGCIEFDGADDMIEALDSSSLQNIFHNGGVVSVWIFPKSAGEGGNGMILRKYDPGWYLFSREEGAGNMKIGFVHSFANVAFWKTTAREVFLDQWNHVAVSYDASDVANDPIFYVNGQSVPIDEVRTPSGSPQNDAGVNLYIGNTAVTSITFDGMIDEAFLFNHPLDSAQIQQLYAVGKEKHQFAQSGN